VKSSNQIVTPFITRILIIIEHMSIIALAQMRIDYGGHSSNFSPDGDIVLQAAIDAEDVFIAEIDESLIRTTRN
jgi:predicted amidohydrolase